MGKVSDLSQEIITYFQGNLVDFNNYPLLTLVTSEWWRLLLLLLVVASVFLFYWKGHVPRLWLCGKCFNIPAEGKGRAPLLVICI